MRHVPAIRQLMGTCTIPTFGPLTVRLPHLGRWVSMGVNALSSYSLQPLQKTQLIAHLCLKRQCASLFQAASDRSFLQIHFSNRKPHLAVKPRVGERTKLTLETVAENGAPKPIQPGKGLLDFSRPILPGFTIFVLSGID